MPKYERCPYCRHEITRAEYEKACAKIQTEMRSRVQQQLFEERQKLQQQRQELRALKKKMGADARAQVRLQVKTSTAKLRSKIERLEDRQDTVHEEGIIAGRLEGERKWSRAQKEIAILQRKLSRKTSDEFGDWSEQDLYNSLKHAFPEDDIARLPKSEGGADILQKVRYHGKVCGVIAFECKNTARWDAAFVAQTRRGGEKAEANHAILVSNMLPPKVKGFTIVGGVPAITPPGALPLTDLIRRSLVEMERLGLSSVQRAEKSKALYDYLCGSTFRAPMEEIVHATEELQKLQSKEKHAHQQAWTQQSAQFVAILNRIAQVQGKVAALLEEVPNPETVKVTQRLTAV